MHPGELAIQDYTYELPGNRIAYYPLDDRQNAKLLLYQNEEISEDVYVNLADHLPSNCLMVLNNAKVIPARILFQKITGGSIEIFCLEPYGNHYDFSTVLNTTGSSLWKCMIGGASKWKTGLLQKTLNFNGCQVVLEARLVKKLEDAYVAEFSWEPKEINFKEIIELAGSVPLPPYIKRNAETIDKDTYQTIYAKQAGSVAAPTAGFHLTTELFEKFKRKNIRTEFLTLHVGAGTFKPVKAKYIKDHHMHAECIEVDISTIKKLAEHHHEIIAVGTTAARTLESLYWMGVKAGLAPTLELEKLNLSQWEAYGEELKSNIDRAESLQYLVKWLEVNNQTSLKADTELIIAPGYKFRMINYLLTNFHQPRSTLLLLVAAAVGEDWRKIYSYALENDFRFLSYGDGSLIKIG